jgi:hypothetical protein
MRIAESITSKASLPRGRSSNSPPPIAASRTRKAPEISIVLSGDTGSVPDKDHHDASHCGPVAEVVTTTIVALPAVVQQARI